MSKHGDFGPVSSRYEQGRRQYPKEVILECFKNYNEGYHLETSQGLGYDIHTLEGNLEYARYLYEKKGVQPWNASSRCWSNHIAMR